MARTLDLQRIRISFPGGCLGRKKEICALNVHQAMKNEYLYFGSHAHMSILYTFCRSEALARCFVDFSLYVVQLEYATFIMV